MGVLKLVQAALKDSDSMEECPNCGGYTLPASRMCPDCIEEKP